LPKGWSEEFVLPAKKKHIPPEDEWSVLFKGYPAHIPFFKGEGCEDCNYTGYKGRTLLSEIFVVEGEISTALNKDYDEDQLKRLALESGMKTMVDDGLLKMDQTTLSEIIRVVPHEMLKAFRARQSSQEEIDDLFESLTGDNAPAKEENVLTDGFTLSNPNAERAIIDAMQSKFERLASEDGEPCSDGESKYFKEFIESSFHEIQEKNHCKKIVFHIEKNNQTGRVEISACPR